MGDLPRQLISVISQAKTCSAKIYEAGLFKWSLLSQRHTSTRCLLMRQKEIFAVDTEQMSAMEAEQMSAVEAGQMSAAETGKMSPVATK